MSDETKSPLGDAAIIDVETVPPARQLNETNPPPEKNKGGRPKGSTTRPDAPSKLARREKLISEAETAGQAVPDNLLFVGLDELPTGEQKENPQTPPADEAASEDKPQPEADANPETHRPLATMIWDSIVIILATLLGQFWFPRKQGVNVHAGEIPYDERKLVIDAFCKYFASIGMILLTPVQELWLAVMTYAVPRVMPTIGVIREYMAKRKAQKPPAAQPGDNRIPKTEPVKPSEPKPADKKEKPPENKPFNDLLAGM